VDKEKFGGCEGVNESKTIFRKERGMRGRGAVVLLLSLMVLVGTLFAQGTGSDWQYFNVFNLVDGGYGTNIPSNYTTDFSTVTSFTPARPHSWSTFKLDGSHTEVGVYGLPGVDAVTWMDEELIGLQSDRAVLRLDVLASSHRIYITAIKLTIWGNQHFDPNEDLAPLKPEDAREFFGVSATEEDYYTGVQFYVDRDDGIPAHAPLCDIFDNSDIAGLPERLLDTARAYYVDFSVPYDPTTAAETLTYDPDDPTDPTLKWIKVGTASTPLGTYNKWVAIFPFRNPIAIPPQFSWTGKNLPFKRIWVVLRTIGCHDCEDTLYGGGIAGITEADTFFVGIDSIADIHCYIDDAYQHKSVPPLGHVEVTPNNPDPTNPLAERWASAEFLYGIENFPPQIYALYPSNVVGSNGPHSDAINVDGVDPTYGGIPGSEYEWASEPSRPATNDFYIFTADSTQLISFMAQDRQSCIGSVVVEIRYLNGGNFPCRIDSIFFRNPLELGRDTLRNGGHGLGWEVYIKADGNDDDCVSDPAHTTPRWGNFYEAGAVNDLGGCGIDSFWIAVGNDGPSTVDDYLDPFLDGAIVRVSVRVFNRANGGPNWYSDTSWIFIVDLSGPNAELVCPSTEGHDNETRAYRDYGTAGNFNRADEIEGAPVPYVWLADSLPVFTIEVYDDYARVHDVTNHGTKYTGGAGGSGFNQRDFEITFIVERQATGSEAGTFMPAATYTLTVTEDDMIKWYDACSGDSIQGVYFDENDEGTGGYLYINFEHLYRSPYRTDASLFELQSGDKVYIIATMIMDDPDYGQGSQKDTAIAYGSIDLYPSDSWCSAGGNDPNYGTKTSFDNHVPLWSVTCPGYTSYSPDTLGIVRIDLVGPYAPTSNYYPPHGWVTSDTTQVITVDLYDQIGFDNVDNPTYYKDNLGDFGPRFYGVSGVNADSIIMNIKVRGCDGTWHPYYGGPEGRNFVINRSGVYPTTHPASVPNLVVEKIRMHDSLYSWWGTRVVFDPYATRPLPGAAAFRSGDEVCVTVYAADNAYTNCTMECGGFGPCPTSVGGCTVVGSYAGGVEKFRFTHYVPGNNWAEDVVDPDGLVLAPRQVARWTFYVDADPPQYQVTEFDQCPFEWKFKITDVARHVGPRWCDAHVAGMGAVDVRIITIDDEDCDETDGIPYNIDTIFINDLPVGEEALVYHDAHLGTYFTAYYGHGMDTCRWLPCCSDAYRADRYFYVKLEEDSLDPERSAWLKLYWGDGDEHSCHFFEPGDSVIVEIYAGDAVNTPWFPATERQVNWRGPYLGGTGGEYYEWHHEFDCYTGGTYLSSDDAIQYMFFTFWRTGEHSYQSFFGDTVYNYESGGTTGVKYIYNDFENPNWQQVWTEAVKIKPDLEVTEVNWFNDEAYDDWVHGVDFHYPPDLHGTYYNLDEVTGEADLSDMDRDPYLGKYAKELNFITFDIQTCTDSIVYEHRGGSHPGSDSVVNHSPYAKVELYDSTGTLIWSREDWYDADCIACWLQYIPMRDGVPYGTDGCIDGGRLIIGPLDQLMTCDTIYDTVYIFGAGGYLIPVNFIPHEYCGWPAPRDWELLVEPYLDSITGDTIGVIHHLIPIYGYRNKDSIVVTVGIHTRTPNMFGEDTLSVYHEYRWDYIIDMEPPTGHFAPLVAVSGYDEVNCVARHRSNYNIRVRLEAITDDGVGCSGGGTTEGWTTPWPLPAVVPYSDTLVYEWHPELNEYLELRYNPGTYYLFTNESFVIHNCADETQIARTMRLVTPVQLYHGIDHSVHPEVAEMTTITYDTLYIADSMYAVATIQDKLGNSAFVMSDKMALDNGLPEIKGIAFCTAIKDSVTGEILDFNCWDPSLFKAPWLIPTQDSLIGVYNFSPPDEPGAICTVYVRIWFNDNMDVGEELGHMVRFRPEGWTHWFPVVPIESYARFFPLANIYADYEHVAGGPLYRSSVPSSDEEVGTPGALTVEPGWNTDREWIGYMIIAGGGLMDGVAEIRVQGFADNAGNEMLPHVYPFRIETRYHPPTMGWPVTEFTSDVSENDAWETPYGGGAGVVTSYEGGGLFGLISPIGRCNDIFAYDFDPSITDSVVFDVYFHTVAWGDSDVPTRPGDAYHFVIDDVPTSPYVWYSYHYGTYAAKLPCSIFDIFTAAAGEESLYASIVFKVYSRFYPGDYVADTVLNLWFDNKVIEGGTDVYLTSDFDGDIPMGTDRLIFLPTTEKIRFVITGPEITRVDKIGLAWIDEVTGAIYPITDHTPPYDDDFIRVDEDPSDGLWYDPTINAIIYEWDCAGELIPGLYRVKVYGINEVTNVYEDDGVVTSETYPHTFMFTRGNIQIPREAFLARGDDFVDAMKRTSCNYPSQPWADDIYPWPNEDKYPDWPGWVYITQSIIEGHEHLHKFQVITFNNPDPTSGITDPLMHSYTEQGGYPGDSIYVLFELFEDDLIYTDSVLLTIEDEYGGPISGSNPVVRHMFYLPDDIVTFTDCLGDTHRYLVYNWVLDDQDNRFDGPAKIVFTTYEHDVAMTSVYATDHPTYVLIDTYDPEYRVQLTRVSGAPMMTCISDSLPGETIWVTNADTIDIYIYWRQTIFDQAVGAEDYVCYDDSTYGRTWDYLRMTIDGPPHLGFHTDDPNDMLDARLYHAVHTTDDLLHPFWHQPDGGYDSYPLPMYYFADNSYKYRWAVASDPAGNGLAMILVKGRDVAGNVLDYDEARYSRSYGKFVLIDTDPPHVNGGQITLTSGSIQGDAGAITDNLLGRGFRDVLNNTYVYVSIYSLDMSTKYADSIPTNDDGSISEAAVTLTAGDTVYVCATDLAGNTGCDRVVVRPEVECCEWELCPGWSLVALSVIPPDLSKSTIFGTRPVFLNRGGTYIPAPDPLRIGDGYLVMSSTADTIVVCGDPVTEFTVDDLQPSWNSIGAIWGDVPISRVDVTPPGAINITQTYYYDCAAHGYVPTNTLHQCRGHIIWVNVAPCTLTVSSAGSGHSSFKASPVTALWDADLIVKAGTIAKTLVVGAADGATDMLDEGVDKPALPAMPGEPEVYLDNHMEVNYKPEADKLVWKLHVIDKVISITPDLSNVPEEYDVFIVVDGNRINLREAGSVTLTEGNYFIVAEKRAVPTKFALGGNYPNPFNTATVIAYEIPKNAHVKIEVFDVTGHKVKTLVNEEQTPGFRTVVWDGTDDLGNEVASGIYIYKLTSGKFVQTRTMMLSK